MGLDLLELILETEKVFGVELRGTNAAPPTAGELFDVTLTALREQHPERFEADTNYVETVWTRQRSIIADVFGVDPEKVTKSTNLYSGPS
jgi:acyl carrier protein